MTTFEITRPVPLLGLDPDLGQRLAPERLAPAARDLHARVAMLPSGPWRPAELGHGGEIGLLVVRGMIVRELCVHETPSAELFGPGDIIRSGHLQAPQEMLRTVLRWHALERAAVAIPQRHTLRALLSYPEVAAVVFERLNARAERLAVSQAISQLTGVEMRVEALLWHVAERWGRVGTEGVIVPVPLSHKLIGSLIGARRPTVSTAVARLNEDGRVIRRPDGSWLLTESEPPCVASTFADPSTTRRLTGRTIERAVPSNGSAIGPAAGALR